MHKLKTYAKLGGVIVLTVFIVMFMASNTEPVRVKFLWKQILVLPTYTYTFFAANAGIFIFLVARKLRKLFRDIKQLRQEEKTRQRLAAEIKSGMEQEQGSKTGSTGKEASHETH
ncbi:MAG: hypothetical protein AMJ79_11165 [Phycisphaerae bacterium SM23_30]|nr:MAG: hypothetical protein AMJ79_11165 [Phycisphaerae bacterium SM23_30]